MQFIAGFSPMHGVKTMLAILENKLVDGATWNNGLTCLLILKVWRDGSIDICVVILKVFFDGDNDCAL